MIRVGSDVQPLEIDCSTGKPDVPFPWLISPLMDLLTFGGSAGLALILVLLGIAMGWTQDDTPEWTWVTAVLLIDVAHVYATGFRVYFVPSELRRRPWLYGLTPLLGYLLGVALYSESESLFWRVLAYVAVFHFVRQQVGWVALYRAKAMDPSSSLVDYAAIYLATLWPLIWWHGHLPRSFWWFREDDFVKGSAILSDAIQPVYWISLFAYGANVLWRGWKFKQWNPGKDLVVGTTALCWYVGIVLLNSDYAFTVTNVLIHGIPYIVFVRWLQRSDEGKRSEHSERQRLRWWDWGKYLGALWILAYMEELLWDRGVWHERSWLFGMPWGLEDYRTLLVPLLAVPQLTHYILDGFIWRRRSNPDLESRF